MCRAAVAQSGGTGCRSACGRYHVIFSYNCALTPSFSMCVEGGREGGKVNCSDVGGGGEEQGGTCIPRQGVLVLTSLSPNLCLAAWQVLKSLFYPARVATAGAVERSGDGSLGGPRVSFAFTSALAVVVTARRLTVVVLRLIRLRRLGQRKRQRTLAVVVLRLRQLGQRMRQRMGLRRLLRSTRSALVVDEGRSHGRSFGVPFRLEKVATWVSQVERGIGWP